MNKQPMHHQIEAMSKIRQSLGKGRKRPMVQLPTGAGKTFIAAMIVESALKKDKRVIFVVPSLSLIDQTVTAFWNEGITEVGVIQSNHRLTDYSKSVQVASIQTLMRRFPPEADVVILDEAHRDFKFTREWMVNPEWEKVIFIGLSATPWTKGLGKHYDDLIVCETTQSLIDKGILSDFRVFAPDHPDLSKVKTVRGDYHEGQLAEVMGNGKLVAGIVSTWLEKGGNRPTLCFAVDRAHARKIQRQFQNAGVGCGYIDAFTEEAEREEVRKKFESGEYRVVSNVGCLTTGVDWDVRCIILARPTKSEMLYVQMIGRGLRTAPGKDHCTILDHADNTLRMGFVTDIKKESLDDGKKKESKSESKEKPVPLPKECIKCAYLKPATIQICPNCGFKPEVQSKIEEIDGELIEVRGMKNDLKKELSMQEKQRWYSGFIYIAQERNYNQKWAVAQYRDKFGVWPNQLHDQPIAPPLEVSNYVKAKLIRWAKRRKSA